VPTFDRFHRSELDVSGDCYEVWHLVDEHYVKTQSHVAILLHNADWYLFFGLSNGLSLEGSMIWAEDILCREHIHAGHWAMLEFVSLNNAEE
jgi:hypothetical protein